MMVTLRNARFRVGSVAALVGVALLLAACGSSSSSSTGGAQAANTGSGYGGGAAASTATPASLSLSTAKSSNGTYLTGASGRALYLWVADHKGQSSCMGACAKVWPPVIAKTMPKASGGASTSDLGTITRTDGTKQLTYKGHPLYYFVEDAHSGMTKGQGSNSFGAKWWLVTPSGAAITSGGSTKAASAPASGSSSNSSSGSSSSSGGGGWG